MSSVFSSERLQFARRRAGLTGAATAKAVAIAPRTLAKYEAGDSAPDNLVTERLAEALGVPASFFFAPPIPQVAAAEVHWRALSKMSAIKRDAALGSGALAIELARWLDERLHLPAPTVPGYARGAVDPQVSAQRLRAEWELGYGRIRNVVHLVEAHGVRVFSLPEHLADVDGFSFWWRSVPFIVLNTRKAYERGRFDVAHELGHLVMHGDYDLPTAREREWEANRFAAAFLMPEQAVLAAGLRNANVDQIIRAKERWGVSAMALTHRLHELGIITEWGYTSACRRLSQLGYRSGEPDTQGTPREASQVLEKAFSLMRDRNVSSASMAADLDIHPADLRELVFGLAMTSVSGEGTMASRPRSVQLHLVNDDSAG